MKKTLSRLSVVFAFTLALCGNGQTVSTVNVVLSPYQATDEAQAIRQRLGIFLLQSPPETLVNVYDGYGLRKIACFQIPRLKFDAPAERAQRMAEPFSNLAKWYAEVSRAEILPPLKNSGALKIPEILERVAQETEERPFSVLLIGSPLSLSIDEPAFSMMVDKVLKIPSDANILTNTTASPYGCAEKSGCLDGAHVHHCYLNEGMWPNPYGKKCVERFWTLFVSRQGGELGTFTADLNRLFEVATRVTHPVRATFDLDPNDTVLEMRDVGQRRMPLRAAAPVVAVTTNIPPIPTAPRGKIGIAAWWQADADVDLYVSAQGKRELFFQNTNTVDGVYYRDVRHPLGSDAVAAWRDRWEYVEINENVAVADLRCWLNLYKVNHALTEPVSGIVRIQFGDGHFSERHFCFSVAQGNGGAEHATRESSPYWIPIDLGNAGNGYAANNLSFSR